MTAGLRSLRLAFSSRTLPSTRPTLKLKISALAFANFEIAFESTTGSVVLNATAVTPLNSSASGSSGVPAAALRAKVFLTTRIAHARFAELASQLLILRDGHAS